MSNDVQNQQLNSPVFQDSHYISARRRWGSSGIFRRGLLAAAAALALTAGTSTASEPAAKETRTCNPERDSTAEQVRAQCGVPEAVFRYQGSAGLYEEWQYGETYVGLLNGVVSYVL